MSKTKYPILRQIYNLLMQDSTFKQVVVEWTPKTPYHIFKILNLQSTAAQLKVIKKGIRVNLYQCARAQSSYNATFKPIFTAFFLLSFNNSFGQFWFNQVSLRNVYIFGTRWPDIPLNRKVTFLMLNMLSLTFRCTLTIAF